MLWFYFRRAVRSLRRTPVLSSVMIMDMALGLAVWIIAFTAVAGHTRVPPGNVPGIYHVDFGGRPRGNPEDLDSYRSVLLLAPHMLLTYRDAAQLANHPAVTRSARTFTSRLVVDTESGVHDQPVRFCSSTLFPMFELGFEHGRSWDETAERTRALQVVLDAETNRRFFGGGNSVGRTLDIGEQQLTVVGVLKHNPTKLRAYDFTFDPQPAMYLPFELFSELGAGPEYYGRKQRHAARSLGPLGSDDVFVQLWVQLPDEARRTQYAAFVAERARARGLDDVGVRPVLAATPDWVKASVPISGGFLLFEICAFVALLTCIVNLSRLLVVKLESRAAELALQRALGATRSSVFLQHIIEALIVSSIATGLGLLIASLGLHGINAIVPDRPTEFAVDGRGFLLACAAGVGAGLLAGALPALRMCRAAPASRLRLQ